MEINELIKSIEKEFSNSKYPGNNELTECPCDECVWSIKRFIGKRWETLQENDLLTDQCDASIYSLSAKAFVYFLPGFIKLSLSLCEEEDFISHYLTSRFTYSDMENEVFKNNVQTIIDLLNSQQRQLVSMYFEILSKRKTEIPILATSAINNLVTEQMCCYSQSLVNEWLDTYFKCQQN